MFNREGDSLRDKLNFKHNHNHYSRLREEKQMKKKLLISLIVFVMLMAPMTTFAAQQDGGITRGEFFNLVVEHLNLETASLNRELPIDVKEGSEYVNAVKVLMSRGIINGFPDGTVRLDQKVTNQEAAYILARFLNIEDKNALSALAKEFSVSFEGEFISVDRAKKLVQATLSSDEKALKWIEKMTIVQSEATSFRSSADMIMSMMMDLGDLEHDLEIPTNMNMTSSLKMDFNVLEGLHQIMTMSMPLGIPGMPDMEMKMEQYFVPEGIFMKIDDPETGEAMWMDMSDTMPFSFEELMVMNRDSLQLSLELNNKFFFYRDLGTEEVDGKVMRKIKMDGKIDSLTEMMGMLNNVLQDGSLIPLEDEIPEMKMGMSGYIWIDEETALPYRQTLDMSMKYTEVTDDLVMPIEMTIFMDMTFTDFNEVNGISLPEEAKNAEKLPALE